MDAGEVPVAADHMGILHLLQVANGMNVDVVLKQPAIGDISGSVSILFDTI
jgi:hypothetical protein